MEWAVDPTSSTRRRRVAPGCRASTPLLCLSKHAACPAAAAHLHRARRSASLAIAACCCTSGRLAASGRVAAAAAQRLRVLREQCCPSGSHTLHLQRPLAARAETSRSLGEHGPTLPGACRLSGGRLALLADPIGPESAGDECKCATPSIERVWGGAGAAAQSTHPKNEQSHDPAAL